MSKRTSKPKRGRKPKTPPPGPGNPTKWVIMKTHRWDSINVMGLPLVAPEEGPTCFLPVFKTAEAAVKWNGGKNENIGMLRTVAPEEGGAA